MINYADKELLEAVQREFTPSIERKLISIQHQLAISYFHLFEYSQCYDILSQKDINEQSPAEQFLRLYSLFMVC